MLLEKFSRIAGYNYQKIVDVLEKRFLNYGETELKSSIDYYH